MPRPSFLSQLYAVAGEPLIRDWLADRGLILGDWRGNRNLLDVIEKHQFDRQLREAMTAAATRDADRYPALFRGLAAVTGAPWTPQIEQSIRDASQSIAPLAPYLMRLAPDVWESLHGTDGSIASLVYEIAEANRGMPGFEPADAVQMAQEIYDRFTNKSNFRGFSAREVGELYREATKRGLVPGIGHPDTIADGLVSLAGPVSAARDYFQTTNRSTDMASLFQFLDRQGWSRGASQLEDRVRLQQQGNPYMMALSASGGVRGSSAPELAALDARLRAQVAASPYGNLMGATARLVREGTLKPGTPGFQLWTQMQAGAPVTHAQWMQAMRASGLSPAMAASVLSDRVGNREFLDDNMIAVLRANQAKYQLTPQQQSLFGPRPADPNARVRFDVSRNRLANSLGYKNWEQFSLLHGSPVQQAQRYRGFLQQRADESKRLSPLGRGNPISRTISALSGPSPTIGSVGSAFLNLYPSNP